MFRKQKPEEHPAKGESLRCSKCGKKLRQGQDYVYMKGTVFCTRCWQAEQDWKFLELHALLDD